MTTANDIYVKPTSDKLLCRHPVTGAKLPADGGYWPDNAQTRRALNSGDIVKIKTPAAGKKRQVKGDKK